MLGDPPLVRAIARGLRRAGARAVTFTAATADGTMRTASADRREARAAEQEAVAELPTSESALIPIRALDQLDEPHLADVARVLIAYEHGDDRVRAAREWSRRVGRGQCHTWVSTSDVAKDDEAIAGERVFGAMATPADVTHGLERGDFTIAVLETQPGVAEPGRLGRDLQPLFWVTGDTARIVDDPARPGPPPGEHAVVLKRRVAGLEGLVEDVVVADVQQPTMRAVILRLLQSLASDRPDLPVDELLQGITEREATMSTAVGGGVAIPHAYYGGIERSRAYVAIVPQGLPLATPDEQPVKLVCLVVSPPNKAKEHLRALGAVVDLVGDEAFRALLVSQVAPERVARLIAERA